MGDGNFNPAPGQEEGFALARFDLDRVRQERLGWGLFRDRRPEHYKTIVTSDGSA